MITRILFPIAVALLLALSAAGDDHLSAFLRVAGGSPEDTVRRMRDVFHGRVRCGVEQGIAKKLCQECLSSDRILNITRPGRDGIHSTTDVVRELARASVVFLNYLLSFRTSCTTESVRQGYVGSCRTYDGCRARLTARFAPLVKNEGAPPAESLETLEKILREVKAVFEPDPSKPCFSAEMVLNELNSGLKSLEALPRDIEAVLLLTSHLYSGECIDVGESVADFLDDLFLHYGDGCERVMTQSGFSQLWNDLQMRKRGKHVDHGVQKSSCSSGNVEPRSRQEGHASSFPSAAVTTTESETVAGDFQTSTSQTTDPTTGSGASSPTLVWTTTVNEGSSRNLENSTTLVVLIPQQSSEGDSPESKLPQNSDVYVVGAERLNGGEERENGVAGRRAARHTPLHPEDHEHKNLANECLPSDDLLQRFLTPGNQVITSSEFLQLCPALVQQAVSGVCSARLKAAASVDVPRGNETREVLLQAASQDANPWFAVAAVSVITAISLLGLFLLPVLKKSFFVHINAFFTGLAFGTMSGDVVLHLMPQYLGLHEHEEHTHDHDAESTMDRLFPSHLQRQLAFLLTMYLLLLMECIFAAFTDGGKPQQHHGHSHGPVDISMRDLTAVSDIENGEMKPKRSRCSKIMEFLKPTNLFSGISSKAAVIVLADTVHNFADGMAIAVGFSTSYKDGFSTSVAVFFHELPHEIGDFAVLMNCGLSYWKAFVFNILSGLSAFLGLGVGVFTASLFREWLLCITAGLFFFVVMGEMLPDMRLESREKWREFVVKILGTVCGIITMICIAIYELSSEA